VAWSEAPATRRGHRVERSCFDAALREAALARGVELVEGSARERDGRVTLRGPAGEEELEAGVFVRATGRPHRASEGAQLEREQPPTVALAVELELEHDPHASAIEAVREGWLWWLPSRRGTVTLSLFVDSEELREQGMEALWRAALASCVGPARAADAQTVLAHSSVGVDATARLRRAGPGELLLGDAAVSLDPMSSQGLETALASAEQLAYAVRTILRDPEQAGLARSACASWNRGLFEQHRTTTREVYAREQRFTQAPFWRARRAQEAELAGRLLPQRFAPHPDAGPAVLGRRVGDVLVPVDAVHVPGRAEPLDRVGAVEVETLLGLVPAGGGGVGEVMANARRAPALVGLDPRALEQSLAALWRLGFLVEPGSAEAAS